MAALLGHEEMGIKATGSSVVVAADPRAKIMYYLHCVFQLIGGSELPGEIRRLGNHRNYASVGQLESVALLALANELSPDVLSGQVLFHSDELCGSALNEFYELSLVSTRLVVADSVLIGGQRRRVKQIMTFRMAWLQRFYLEPILQLIASLERQQQQQRQRHRALPAARQRSQYSERGPLLAVYSQQPKARSSGCCCTIL